MLGERLISNRTQQLLQQTLSNWQSWQTGSLKAPLSQPQIVKELVGGRTNKTYLVAAGDFSAVVRINAENSVQLGIDRQREAQILDLLQPTGLTPRVYFISDDVLVSEFIEGPTLSAGSMQESHAMHGLTNALLTIQGIQMPGSRRNYLKYCRDYIAQLSGETVSNTVVEQIEQAAIDVDNADWEPVICHHDMVPENIIQNERGLFIIDWEYAALGHPGLDFLRLYGADYAISQPEQGSLKSLLKVKQAMDKLWLAVQL